MVISKKHKLLKFFHPVTISSLLMVIFIYTGAIPVKNKNDFIALGNNEEIIEISGKIVSNPNKSEKNHAYYAILQSKSIKYKNGLISSGKGKIKIQIAEEILEAYLPGKLYTMKKNKNALILEEGSKIICKGKYSKGIFFVNTVQKDFSDQNKIDFFYKIRAISRLQFRRIMYSWGSAGGLLLALLSGIKEYTDMNLSDNFRKAGLSHILALSGMHLNLISKLVSKKMILIKLFLIFIFVFFAGFSPSLFRAFLCSIFSILVYKFKIKDMNMIIILSLSFLIHISLRQEDIFQTGFILSYSALAGIILTSEFIKILCIIKSPEALSGAISSSIGAQFFTAPITLKLFNTFAPGGTFATIIVSPLITLFIYAGLLLIILSFLFPFLGPAAAFFMKKLYNIISFCVSSFAHIPNFSTGI